MTGKIEKSHKKYMEYDPNVWVREFFDSKTGGYVVVNRKRKVNAVKYKQEGEKYEKEFVVANTFAQNGYAMEMMKEISGVSSPDVTINGIPAEIKCVKSAANMVRHAKKANKINVPARRRHFTTSLRDEGWYEAPEALQVPVRYI